MDTRRGESAAVSGNGPETATRSAFNPLVTRIAIDFLNVDAGAIDAAIDRALAAVTAFLGAERAFVVDGDGTPGNPYTIRYDWHADGATAVRTPPSEIGPYFQTACKQLRSGQNVRLDDLDAEPSKSALFGDHERSAFIVPMSARGVGNGAIGVTSAEPNHPWADDVHVLLRVVGEVIIVGRERQAVDQSLRHRIAAEEVIRSIATLVIGLTADQIEDGYTQALDSIGNFLGLDRCYMRLSGAGDDPPTVAGWRADHAEPFSDEMIKSNVFDRFPWAHEIFAQNECIVLNSIDDLPDMASAELKFIRESGIKAVAAAPVLASNKLVGILVAEMNHTDREWSDVDIMLLSIVAQILGGMRVRQLVNEERRRLEAQVQHAQKLESMGVLAGGIAHDFNNLLVGILGNAELLLMNTANDASARKHLEQIQTSANRAADLVNQLLTFTGKGHFRIEPLDMSDLIGGLTVLVPTIIARKIDVKSDLTPDLPLIAGDRTQMRQVIMNLITNAADAIGDAPGKILLYTGCGSFEEDYLRETVAGAELEAGDYVFIEVTDTGCGMETDIISRIFDPFFTTKFAGRGLGLAATLGIVRAHHGTIKVMSWPQKGTTVQILLPATSVARAEPDPPAPDEPETPRTGTVLVIDDEVSVRRVTRSVLEHFGYNVLVAENGMRGLRVLEQNASKVDLIILDMSMPKMDGDETLRRIREVERTIPIVLTSGYTEIEIEERINGLDASGFIGKPFSPKELIEQVRKSIAG